MQAIEEKNRVRIGKIIVAYFIYIESLIKQNYYNYYNYYNYQA